MSIRRKHWDPTGTPPPEKIEKHDRFRVDDEFIQAVQDVRYYLEQGLSAETLRTTWGDRAVDAALNDAPNVVYGRPLTDARIRAIYSVPGTDGIRVD